MKATQQTLERIHELMARDMLDRLENGALVTDKDGVPVLDENGQPLRRSLTAAEWTAVLKFLKDNGIDAALGTGEASNAFRDLVNRAAAAVPSIRN